MQVRASLGSISDKLAMFLEIFCEVKSSTVYLSWLVVVYDLKNQKTKDLNIHESKQHNKNKIDWI